MPHDNRIIASFRDRLRSATKGGKPEDLVRPRLGNGTFQQGRDEVTRRGRADGLDDTNLRVVAVAFFPFLDETRVLRSFTDQIETVRLTDPANFADPEQARRAVEAMLAVARAHGLEGYAAFYQETLNARPAAHDPHDEIRTAIVAMLSPLLPEADAAALDALALAAYPWLVGVPPETVAPEVRARHNAAAASPYDIASDRLLRLAEAVHDTDAAASRRYEQAAAVLLDMRSDQTIPRLDPDDPLAALDDLITDPFGIDFPADLRLVRRGAVDEAPSEEATKLADMLMRAVVASGQSDLGVVFDDTPADLTVHDAVRRLGVPTPAERIERFLSGFNDRDRDLLTRRIFAPKERRVTLEELGRTWALTRERVRQLQTKLEENLADTGWTALFTYLAGLLLYDRPAVTPHEELRARARVLAEGDDATANLIIDLAGPWHQTDGWVWHRMHDETVTAALAAVRDAADEHRVVPETAVAEHLPDALVRETDLDEFLASHRIYRVETVYAIGRALPARVAAALRHIGRPATTEEVLTLLPGANPKSVSTALSAISGVVRADRERWGFEEWVDDVYEGITGEIDQRIAQHDGAVPLELLLDELPRRFGVAESSVRTYLATPAYAVADGLVRHAGPDNFQPVDPATVPDTELSPAGWGQVVRLTADTVERGYSILVSPHIAHANGVRLGDSLRVALTVAGPSDDPDDASPSPVQASVIWRATSTSGKVEIGRAGSTLRERGLTAGDHALVVPTPGGVTILHRQGPPTATDGVAPHHLTVTAGTHQVDLPALTGQSGNAWFSTAIDGKPAHGGVRIPAAGNDPLPAHVHVGDTRLPLGPVPKYDESIGGYVDDEFDDFDRTRRAEGEVLVNGRRHHATIRVTRRQDGGWNVTAKVYPQGGQGLRPAPPSTHETAGESVEAEPATTGARRTQPDPLSTDAAETARRLLREGAERYRARKARSRIGPSTDEPSH